jgi:sterol 14alpha-demethylase
MLVIVTAVVAVVVAALVFMLRGKKRPANAPPNVNIGLPLIGNFMEFGKNPVAFAGKCREEYGHVYTVPMMHKHLTFLFGTEASTPFFKLGDEQMSQPEVYGFMTPVFGKGVIYDAEPKRRYQQMQQAATGLKKDRLVSYVPKIEWETVNYFSEWGKTKGEGKGDLLVALSELTILSATRCLHGDDVRDTMFNDVARLFHDLDKGTEPLSFFFPYLPTPAHALRDKARLEMVEIFSKVIQKRRDDTTTKPEDRTDLLQLFIDFKYRDGEGLSNDQVVGMLIAMLFAGQHTSSVTSTWTAMFLVHNPRCYEKVMAEQAEVLGGDLGKKNITFEDVQNMTYLGACVKEALRMHPPLILLMRMAMCDIETSHEGKKFTIPKGDIVVTSPAAASRMDSIFTNPNAFEPERFLPGREEDKKCFNSFLGFGAGRHACMGQQFGMLQIVCLLSVLLRNFKLEATTSAFPEPDYTAMVVGPKNNCTVKYTKLPTAWI